MVRKDPGTDKFKIFPLRGRAGKKKVKIFFAGAGLARKKVKIFLTGACLASPKHTNSLPKYTKMSRFPAMGKGR